MQLLVLVERVARGSYRARTGEPLALAAEGTSRDEALLKLHQLVREKIRSGADLTEFNIPSTGGCSWPPPSIYDPNDPVIQKWKEIMEENRRKADEDPDYV
jgi:hypothetical protein